MKTLSIKQPYAALIAAGLKPFEIRTWQTQYRGELLIHAGKAWHENFRGYNFFSEILGLKHVEDFIPFPNQDWLKMAYQFSPVCVVDLVDIRPMTQDDEPKAFCPYIPGAFSWVLENARLVEPFAMSGKLSLFETPNELIKFI